MLHRPVADRWVPDVSPDDPIFDAAVRTVRGRVRAVRYYMPLAAKRTEEDPESLHQLRVWSRRATAALRFFEGLFPRRRHSWVMRQLRHVRRAVSDARDCDVLAARLAGERDDGPVDLWLAMVRADRAKAQKAVVAVAARLNYGKRLTRRVRKLLKRIGRPAGPNGVELAQFGPWARARLRPLVIQFLAAALPDAADETGLHQFRIRAKNLRFALEIAANALPDELQIHLASTLEAWQDWLGTLNDLATATASLRRRSDRSDDPREAAIWRRLLAREEAELDRCRQEFRTWCSPSRVRTLRLLLERLLDTSAERDVRTTASSTLT